MTEEICRCGHAQDKHLWKTGFCFKRLTLDCTCKGFASVPKSKYVSKNHNQQDNFKDVSLGEMGFLLPYKVIDVSIPEEVLWKNVSRSHRRSIRKGTKQGLVVKEATTKKEYDKVIKIIKETAKRNGIFAHDSQYYYDFFEIFGKANAIKVWYIDKVATITTFIFGGKVIQTHIAHSDYSVKNSIYGVDFLEWHIIKWCRDNPCDKEKQLKKLNNLK